MDEQSIVITAFGVSRKSSEWAKLPVCVVNEIELIRRIGLGVEPEVAITHIHVAAAAGQSPNQKIRAYLDREATLRSTPRITGQGQGTKKHSRFLGVSRRKGSLYFAQIRISRDKVKYLGEFNTEVEAAVAYDLYAIKMGKRNRNFPKLSIAQLEEVAKRASL